MRATLAATFMPTTGVLRWRRLGVIIPFALALMVTGTLLIGQALWIHVKAVAAQVLLNRAFAETILTGHDVKPWPWADTWPVARVEVPRLGRSAIVLAGSSGQALAFGPGQLERTPAAGEPGTAIYSAHRDTHFAFLGNVAVGDEIFVTRRDGQASVSASPAPRWCAGMPLASTRSPTAGIWCW
jgi:sortase A